MNTKVRIITLFSIFFWTSISQSWATPPTIQSSLITKNLTALSRVIMTDRLESIRLLTELLPGPKRGPDREFIINMLVVDGDIYTRAKHIILLSGGINDETRIFAGQIISELQ